MSQKENKQPIQKYRENKGHGKFPNVYDELFDFVTICRALASSISCLSLA